MNFFEIKPAFNNFLFSLYKNLFLVLLIYYFLIFFSYPLFFKRFVNIEFYNNYSIDSQILLLFYLFIFILCFLIFKKLKIASFNYNLDEWSEKRVQIFIIVMPIFILFLKCISFLKSNTSDNFILHLTSPNLLFFIYHTFIFSILFDEKFKYRKIYYLIFFIISFLFISNSILFTNSRFQLSLYFSFVMLFLILKQKNFFHIISLVILFLFLFAFQNNIKNLYPKHFNENYQIKEALSAVNSSLKLNSDNINTLEGSPIYVKIFNPIVSRISQHVVFDAFVRNSDIKFHGETFTYIYKSLLPDIVKSKSHIKINGNFIGQKFGLIGFNDKKTGVGATLIGDLYINSSILPLLIIPFLSYFYYFFSAFQGMNNRGLFIYSLLFLITIHGFEGYFYSFIPKIFELFIIQFSIILFVKKNTFLKNFKILN